MNKTEERVQHVVHEGRVVSIDVFRGLTILSMIFVNDLGNVRGVPWWMKHMPTETDGMTFVDVVFPAFLFIVGMAIPFAIKKRRDKGDSLLKIWRHIVIRSFALLVIGVFMVNMYTYNKSAAIMSKHLWVFMMFVGVILVWNQYPRGKEHLKPLFRTLRFFGVALLIATAVLYRGGSGDDVIWMRTSWWGILGLIGWAYLTSCAGYLLFRKHIEAMMGFLALLVLLYIGDESGALSFLGFIRRYVWLGGQIGGHSSITVAGVIVGMLFLEYSPVRNTRQRIIWILSFGVALCVAGFLLRPLYGINKVRATPSWCLYSSGICCFLYVFFYWLIDIRKEVGWTRLIKPAGANPLLAYILPDIFYAILGLLGITFLHQYLNEGLLGIFRSLLFAFAMVGITDILYKLHIRLRL